MSLRSSHKARGAEPAVRDRVALKVARSTPAIIHAGLPLDCGHGDSDIRSRHATGRGDCRQKYAAREFRGRRWRARRKSKFRGCSTSADWAHSRSDCCSGRSCSSLIDGYDIAAIAFAAPHLVALLGHSAQRARAGAQRQQYRRPVRLGDFRLGRRPLRPQAGADRRQPSVRRLHLHRRLFDRPRRNCSGCG